MKYAWVFTLLLVPTATWAQSNIDPANKFAWSENCGWTNWLDANGGTDGVFVDVPGGFLDGFIWGENVGWINVGNGPGPYTNTDGTNFGVNILGDDDLDGMAWGENIGWVNFGWGAAGDLTGRAQFDSGAGRFRGYAWGENIGWINLDDATSYVGIVSTCVDADDCDDMDACTQNECNVGNCNNPQRKYADVDNNGTINLFDLFCVLDGFADIFTPPCTKTNVDIEPCTGNGTINLSDLFGVLNAFSDINPCACSAGPP